MGHPGIRDEVPPMLLDFLMNFDGAGRSQLQHSMWLSCEVNNDSLLERWDGRLSSQSMLRMSFRWIVGQACMSADCSADW